MVMKIQALLVSTTSSNSFFIELSRRVEDRVSLYVYKHPRDSLYYVIAYVPKPLESSSVLDIMKDHHENILKISRYTYPQETYLVTVKQRCEFYELIEDYKVFIPVPYTIYKGYRVYCVYGDTRDVDKYAENVIARYGRRNIIIRKIDPIMCIAHQVKNMVNSYVFTALTDKEKQLLVKAFESGYISFRRKVGLEELADSLNIAKSTASLMLRKAIEKILKRLIETEF